MRRQYLSKLRCFQRLRRSHQLVWHARNSNWWLPPNIDLIGVIFVDTAQRMESLSIEHRIRCEWKEGRTDRQRWRHMRNFSIHFASEKCEWRWSNTICDMRRVSIFVLFCFKQLHPYGGCSRIYRTIVGMHECSTYELKCFCVVLYMNVCFLQYIYIRRLIRMSEVFWRDFREIFIWTTSNGADRPGEGHLNPIH